VQGWAKIKTAAKYADISPRSLRSWLKAGLEYSRLSSGTILIRYSSIDKFLEGFSVHDNEVDHIVNEIAKELKQGK
jgi:hypothetical protein